MILSEAKDLDPAQKQPVGPEETTEVIQRQPDVSALMRNQEKALGYSSQHLNKTIRPYLDTTYMVKSSNELLSGLSSLRVHKVEKYVSLDVESLFTYVRVWETIDLIR